MKKKPLPIGISDFKHIIEGGYAYVDKSLFIEELIEKGGHVSLIPRPRRFGKTLNLSMLRYFFDKNESNTAPLFQDLAIWKKEEIKKYQGKFPVIFLTFKDIKHTAWEKTYEHFSRIMAAEFQRHRYLMESDILSTEEKGEYLKILKNEASEILLEESLLLLTKWLYFYHKSKVVVLVDEYDAPTYCAYIGKYYGQLIEFIRAFLSSGFKDNPYLERGVLTGILRIAKESIFSGLNNIAIFSLLNERFEDHFGLTENEVTNLLKEYGLQHRLLELKKWYNGYHIGTSSRLYNPWSLLNSISQDGKLSLFWVNTSDNALIKQLITQGSSELKADLEYLLEGNILEKKIEEGFVFTDLEKKSSAIWSLLLFSGYLTIDAFPLPSAPYPLRIPNQEVQELYQLTIIDWFEQGLNEQKYRLLFNSLTKGDIETFSQLFQEFILSSASSFDISGKEPEKIYHAFVLGMLIGLKDRYEIKSNRESGLGRYDVMLIPKQKEELGIVMEFKTISPFKKTDLKTAAESALKQIEDKQYAKELLDRDVKNILYLAFAFEGKEVFILPKFL